MSILLNILYYDLYGDFIILIMVRLDFDFFEQNISLSV